MQYICPSPYPCILHIHNPNWSFRRILVCRVCEEEWRCETRRNCSRHNVLHIFGVFFFSSLVSSTIRNEIYHMKNLSSILCDIRCCCCCWSRRRRVQTINVRIQVHASNRRYLFLHLHHLSFILESHTLTHRHIWMVYRRSRAAFCINYNRSNGFVQCCARGLPEISLSNRILNFVVVVFLFLLFMFFSWSLSHSLCIFVHSTVLMICIKIECADVWSSKPVGHTLVIIVFILFFLLLLRRHILFPFPFWNYGAFCIVWFVFYIHSASEHSNVYLSPALYVFSEYTNAHTYTKKSNFVLFCVFISIFCWFVFIRCRCVCVICCCAVFSSFISFVFYSFLYFKFISYAVVSTLLSWSYVNYKFVFCAFEQFGSWNY